MLRVHNDRTTYAVTDPDPDPEGDDDGDEWSWDLDDDNVQCIMAVLVTKYSQNGNRWHVQVPPWSNVASAVCTLKLRPYTKGVILQTLNDDGSIVLPLHRQPHRGEYLHLCVNDPEGQAIWITRGRKVGSKMRNAYGTLKARKRFESSQQMTGDADFYSTARIGDLVKQRHQARMLSATQHEGPYILGSHQALARAPVVLTKGRETPYQTAKLHLERRRQKASSKYWRLADGLLEQQETTPQPHQHHRYPTRTSKRPHDNENIRDDRKRRRNPGRAGRPTSYNLSAFDN